MWQSLLFVCGGGCSLCGAFACLLVVYQFQAAQHMGDYNIGVFW